MLEAAVLLGPARSVDRTPVFPGLADALAWLDTERENLVRAVVAAGEHDLVAPCWEMADALFRFYDLRRYLTDWQQVSEVALHAAERAGLHEVEGRMQTASATCTPSRRGSTRHLRTWRRRWRSAGKCATPPARGAR